MQADMLPRSLFKKMGVTISIKKGTTTVESFNAFLQPLRYKNKIYLRGVATELGYDSLKKYLLLCPADVNLSDIDGTTKALYFGNIHLSIDHTETVYLGKTPYYNWTIVSKEE